MEIEKTLPRWTNFLLESLTVNSLALLDFSLSSDPLICFPVAFPKLGNFDHAVVSVSIVFPSNSKRDAPFHCRAYDYWDVWSL